MFYPISRKNTHFNIITGIAVGLVCMTPLALGQPKYQITDLGTLGGSSTAFGINNSGQVVGISVIDAATGSYHAFRTAPNSAINPTTDDLGGLTLTCNGGTFSGSYAAGIDRSGRVVGHTLARLSPEGHSGCSTSYRGFRTAPNSPINPAADDLVGNSTEANGINSSGQVVGIITFAFGSGFFHAFRTAPNSAINPATDDLGTLGGNRSSAYGVNDSGQVVGLGDTANGLIHAFRTAPNSAINPATDDLGTLGGTFSSATGINSSGQVVGSTYTGGNSTFHAFVHMAGVMYDLNNLIPSSPGWELSSALGINDAGQIVGQGFHDGQRRAFRLDPVITVGIDIKPGDEPASINPGSSGMTPVAMLSTPSFSAPAQINRTSLTFGRTGDEQSLASCSSPVDVNKDGLPDLVCNFSTRLTGFQAGDTTGVLKGKTAGGIPLIVGTDTIRIVH